MAKTSVVFGLRFAGKGLEVKPPRMHDADSDKVRDSQYLVLCPECRVHLNAFVEAVREVMQLSQLQMDALLANEADPHRFDLLIHDASERKQNAKYAYLVHLDSHRGASQR
ncbi:MAG: hypothetical protein JNK87_20875 [Bryobacterales bacterium]|nr:hypothetical protein [Bryobacterales bacterium]